MMIIGSRRVIKTTKKDESGESIESWLTVSQIVGAYLCCWMRCCYEVPSTKKSSLGYKTLKNSERFKSHIMADLENSNFILDKSLDAEYLQGDKKFNIYDKLKDDNFDNSEDLSYEINSLEGSDMKEKSNKYVMYKINEDGLIPNSSVNMKEEGDYLEMRGISK